MPKIRPLTEQEKGEALAVVLEDSSFFDLSRFHRARDRYANVSKQEWGWRIGLFDGNAGTDWFSGETLDEVVAQAYLHIMARITNDATPTA